MPRRKPGGQVSETDVRQELIITYFSPHDIIISLISPQSHRAGTPTQKSTGVVSRQPSTECLEALVSWRAQTLLHRCGSFQSLSAHLRHPLLHRLSVLPIKHQSRRYLHQPQRQSGQNCHCLDQDLHTSWTVEQALVE